VGGTLGGGHLNDREKELFDFGEIGWHRKLRFQGSPV
jgi:hypothetical protein